MNTDKTAIKSTLAFIGISLFCVLFNFIYSFFGHGVKSDFMTYAFAIPLLCGVIPYAIMIPIRPKVPVRAARIMWNCGIVTLTLGSLSKGVFDIAGTASDLLYVHLLVGAGLLVAGILTAIIGAFVNNCSE